MVVLLTWDFFTQDLSSLEICWQSRSQIKKMVLEGEKKKNGDHIKSKLTFILARVWLHDDTLMFHREICLKAHEHMKGKWSI